jgi:hypothetical protein
MRRRASARKFASAGTSASGATRASRYGSLQQHISRTMRARAVPWRRKLYRPSGSFSCERIVPTHTTGSIAGRL